VRRLQYAVKDSVGEDGVGHGCVPALDRQLAGHQDGTPLGPVLDDLEQVTAGLDRGGGKEEGVEHEQRYPPELAEQSVTEADRDAGE
jgi:hypothetical protein